MKKLVIIGNDKIGGLALESLSPKQKLKIIVDRSTNYKRLFKLIKNQSISFTILIKMVFAEFLRKSSKPSSTIDGIKTNKELINIINNFNPQIILLFRAGLIVNKKVLSLGIPILNIHCAKIPEFGGLGSIAKALEQKKLEQEATLHHVTKRIDDGAKIDSEKFILKKDLSYSRNEDIAYTAGIRLLKKVIRNFDENKYEHNL